MKRYPYYYLIYFLLFFASCAEGNTRSEDPTTEDQVALAGPEEAVSINLPEAVFTDGDKVASGFASTLIQDRITELVDTTPGYASIYISIFAFHDFPFFVNALERAVNRNVKIHILVDASIHDQTQVAKNKVYADELKTWENVSLTQVNNTAGSISINHNKFILFSEIVTENGAVEKVVFQTSHNFTESATKKIQDAVTLANEGLYDAYLDYWQDTKLLAEQEDIGKYEYREYHDPEEGITAFFYPRRSKEAVIDDNILGLFDDITDPSSSTIKIGMSLWAVSRKSLLEKLEELLEKGAKIEVVTKSIISQEIIDGLKELEKKGAFVKIYNMTSSSSRKLNIHSKFIIIEGEWRGEQTNLVLMGTQNFTNNAYKFNLETSLLFQDHEFYPIYRDYYEKLKALPALCP